EIVCDGTAASGDCYLSENFQPGVQGASELRDHADREPTRWTPPSEELWIRHFVRWPKDWQWPARYGGIKLGRLRVADSCQRGSPCIQSYWGPIIHDDPSKIRWTYAYTLDGGRMCCPRNEVIAPLPGGFQTDRWYCLELHIRQNTKTTPPDGLMEIFIDGQRVAANGSVDTRGNSGPGTFAWNLVNITDNFVGPTGGSAAAADLAPALHFAGLILASTLPRGPSRPAPPRLRRPPAPGGGCGAPPG